MRPAPARRAARRPLRARTTAPRPALPRRPFVSLRVPSCPFMCLYTSSRVPPLSLSPRPPLLPPLSLDARRTVHVRVRVRVPSFVQRTRTALRMCPFPHGEVPVIGDTVCSSSSPGGGPGTTPGCRAGPRTLSARSLDETCAARAPIRVWPTSLWPVRDAPKRAFQKLPQHRTWRSLPLAALEKQKGVVCLPHPLTL